MIFDMEKFRPHKLQREFFQTPTDRIYLFHPFIRTDYSSIVNSIKMGKEILQGDNIKTRVEVEELVMELERTALELRELIGEA